MAPNQFPLYDEGTSCMIRASVDGGALAVQFDPLRRPEVIWRGRGTPKPASVVFHDAVGTQRQLAVREADRAWAVTTPAGGGRVTFHW